jgi:hypothetical protein
VVCLVNLVEIVRRDEPEDGARTRAGGVLVTITQYEDGQRKTATAAPRKPAYIPFGRDGASPRDGAGVSETRFAIAPNAAAAGDLTATLGAAVFLSLFQTIAAAPSVPQAPAGPTD